MTIKRSVFLIITKCIYANTWQAIFIKGNVELLQPLLY
jgi:hypothetical protein